MASSATEVVVSPTRLERWLHNFAGRHGETALVVERGALVGVAADGSDFVAHPPFGRQVDSDRVSALVEACAPPADWGVLLVRKGGFGVARLAGVRMVAHKVGRRHVQGRTKAGGQSQQRFARRRDNQARDAYRAAADHAARLLQGLGPVAVGGDGVALDAVLADPRLARLVVLGRRLDVPEPRRAALDRAVADACSVRMAVRNAD